MANVFFSPIGSGTPGPGPSPIGGDFKVSHFQFSGILPYSQGTIARSFAVRVVTKDNNVTAAFESGTLTSFTFIEGGANSDTVPDSDITINYTMQCNSESNVSNVVNTFTVYIMQNNDGRILATERISSVHGMAVKGITYTITEN